MKKILFSLAVIAVVAVGTFGATRAYFSSTATISGNTFTSGTMALKIDANPDPSIYQWEPGFPAPANMFSNLKPGDTGSQIIDLKNEGSIDGNTTLQLNLASSWNALMDNLVFTVSYDANHDGTWVHVTTGTLAQFNGNTYTLGAITGANDGPAPIGKLASVKIEWSVPTTAGNDIQGLSVTLNAVFGLTQSVASSEPKVGAKLSSYVAPSCTVTVTGSNSVQTAINTAAAGSTICVDSGYTGAGDTGPIQVNQNNDTLAATTQGVAIVHPVELVNSGTKVTGFHIVSGPVLGENAAVYIIGGANSYNVSFNNITSAGSLSRGVLTSTAVTGGVISNNTFSSLTSGIYLNPTTGPVSITYNDFLTNNVGIGSDSLSNATVTRNVFSGNTGEAWGLGTPGSGNVAHENNFIPAGTGNNVNWYTSGSTVDATNNWWDSEVDTSRTNNITEVIVTSPAGSAFAHN
jgi:predicted ribosomally synthesized peptide with SipW-like signal peptide